VLLENYEIAKQRGANILGELVGYGFSSDGYHLSVPSEMGLYSSMKMALNDAGRQIDHIDYICAHATSTPAGDQVEAMAIHKLFGKCKPGVSSLKSMCGHELWMAGAGQVVYTTLMHLNGFTAPNINFTEPDQYSKNINIIKERLDIPPNLAMLNSAGFGGTNSSLVISYDV